MIKKLSEKEVFKSRIYRIKDIELVSGDKQVTYQIIEKVDGAIIVPVTEKGNLVVVNEYFSGINAYQISFPKGKIESGHNELQTANKELQEEVGYIADKLTKLTTITVSPGYLTQKITIFLAEQLTQSKLEGDELEELEASELSFTDFEKLIESGEVNDARIIAAFYLAKKHLNK